MYSSSFRFWLCWLGGVLSLSCLSVAAAAAPVTPTLPLSALMARHLVVKRPGGRGVQVTRPATGGWRDMRDLPIDDPALLAWLQKHPLLGGTTPNVVWMSAGGDATFGLEALSSTSTATTGAVTAATDQAFTGSYSYKCGSGASGGSAYARMNGVAGVNRRLCLRFRTDTIPSANKACGQTLPGNDSLLILTPTGVLRARGVSGTTPVAANTWARVEVAWTITSTTVNEFRLWLNGNLEITATNVTLASAAPTDLLFGLISATEDNNHNVWFDDLFIDDGATLDETGPIRVTAKLPGAVNTNDWNTVGGTGAVNERPLSTTNYVESVSISDFQTYAVQARSAGDVNLTNAVLVGFQPWVYAKKTGTSTGAYIYFAGARSGSILLLTASYAHYYSAVTSSTYPSNAAGIGIENAGTGTQDKFLAECGFLVAWQSQTYSITVTATQPTAASVIKQVNVTRTATQAQAASIIKTVNVTRTATQATAASVVKTVNLVRTATQSTAATIIKTVNIIRKATQAQAASLKLDVAIVRTASQSTAASIIKQVNVTRTASQPTAASIIKQVSIVRTATQATAASIIKQVQKTVLATVTAVATVLTEAVLTESSSEFWWWIE